MRIVYVLSGTGIFDGSSKSLMTLLNFIKKQTTEILVVMPNKGPLFGVLKQQNIKVLSLPYYFDTYPIGSFKRYFYFGIKYCLNFISSLCLFFKCLSFRPSIIHSNTSANNIGYNVAKWLKIPHIWHIREYGDKDFGMKIRNIRNKLFAPNNYTISITKNISNYRNLPCDENHKIIYNGIISATSGKLNYLKKDYFLYAGRIEFTKGIQDCINAFIKFKRECQSDTKLLIAGGLTKEGEVLKQNLISLIKESGYEDSVEWLGERKDINQLMANSLATLVSSHSEAFGRVMAEAMSNGSLVIGKNTEGTKEQFDNGLELTGREIGFRYNTINQLTTHLKNIYNCKGQGYKQMIDDAYLTVMTYYESSRYVKSVFDFYLSIINR